MSVTCRWAGLKTDTIFHAHWHYVPFLGLFCAKCGIIIHNFSIYRNLVPMPPMDKTDLKILDLLQNDASRSTNEIADQVGLSASPCWRRISLLEQQGVIRRRVALLDREKIGLGVTVVVQE